MVTDHTPGPGFKEATEPQTGLVGPGDELAPSHSHGSPFPTAHTACLGAAGVDQCISEPFYW